MKISKRDWAQLSAYLDGELSQRDSSKLQNRIESNPDFQAALEDLKTVKTVLSHTPRLSVPRNFTVRHSVVESPRRQSPIWGYRLAAATLSFLFIGVVVLDIGSGVLKGGMSAALAPREEEVMLEAAADEMEEPALQMAKEAVEEELAPEAEMQEAPAAAENLETGMEGESVPLEGDATMAAEEEADRGVGADEEYFGEESQDTQNLLSEDEEIEPEEAWILPDQEIDQAVGAPPIRWTLILEITLGLGAVGFGFAAWLDRRKKRK